MKPPLYLGIDLGTSYFKVGLFDAAGKLHGLGRIAVEVQEPTAGFRELSISQFWHFLRRGLRQALTEARAEAGQIKGMSYSCQANTFLLLDKTDAPLTPLIFWNDARAEPVDTDIAEFSAREDFRRTIGLGGLTGGFAVAKWRWFQTKQPELWSRTKRIMTLSDYFTFALTGEYTGDAGTAAFLGLYDLGNREWWPEALKHFEIDSSMLSKPISPGSSVGWTTKRAVELLGVPAGIAYAVGGFDHHVAALGSGLGKFADVSISTGTVLAAVMLVDEVRPLADCCHGLHFDGQRMYRLTYDPRGAKQLEDYQRDYAPHCTLEGLIELAGCVQPGTLPDHKGPRVRAKSDIIHGEEIRLRMEKIAAIQRELVARVADGTSVTGVIATGGGARSTMWLQIKADMLGVPVSTSSTPERACLGAAILASVAAGVHRDQADAMDVMVAPGPRYDPDPGNTAFYLARFQ